MPESEEITPYSLCDDCPCECHTKSYKWTVLSCGKRATHEASNSKQEV